MDQFRPVAKAEEAEIKPPTNLAHPVQEIQAKFHAEHVQAQRFMEARLYGSALALQRMTEEKILGQVHRLPVLPSAHVGLGVVRNDNENFGFEDWIGDRSNSEGIVDVHKSFEAMVGLDKPFSLAQ